MNNVELPDVNEPLVLADGTIINPLDGTVMVPENAKELVEVPTDRQAVSTVTSIRKRISDLPVPPAQMNVVTVILSYSLMGLSDNDIARCVGIPLERVKAIKLTDVYSDVHAALVEQMVAAEQENVRMLLNQGAMSAAKMITSLINSDDDKIALAASRDILDRDGHRPADVVEHRHKIDGGLTITYVDKKDSGNVLEGVAIDITDGEFDD